MYSKIRVLSRADSKNGRLRNTIKINSFRNTRIILSEFYLLSLSIFFKLLNNRHIFARIYIHKFISLLLDEASY